MLSLIAESHGCRRRATLLSSAMLVCAAWPSIATAQAQEGASVDVDDGPTNGEIVVTAQRRTESIQKAAIAVTALPAERLAAAGRFTLEDQVRTVPAVLVSNTPGGGTYYVRGIGSQPTTDASVSFNFDGIYQGDGTRGRNYDIARIEVLRGPQGTLYGRNAVAGVVNLITNAPKLAEYEGGMSLQYGNYEQVRAEAFVNAPLGGRAAVRASGLVLRHDGYYTNGGAAENTKSGRLRFLFEPTSALRIQLGGSLTEARGTLGDLVALPIVGPAWVSTDRPGATVLFRKDVTGQVDLDLGWSVITWLGGYYRNNLIQNQDVAGLGLTQGGGLIKQHTEELRIASPASSAVKWTVGGYYLHSTNLRTPLDITERQYAQGPLQPIRSPIVTNRNQRSESFAVFGEVTVPLTEQFRVVGGLRYSKDEKSLTAVAYTVALQPPIVNGAGTPFGPASVATGIPSRTFETESGATTFRAAAQYDVSSSNLLYAQISTGYKAGGVNELTTALSGGLIPNTTTYAPERLTAYEIGSKNRFGNITLNFAGFYYNYKNQQVLRAIIIPGAILREISNSAATTIYGGEAEGEWKISRYSRIYGNVAYTHSRFDTFLYRPTVGAPIDYSGTPGLNAPLWSGTIGFEQRFELGSAGTVSISGERRMYSSSRYTIEPDPLATQAAYHMSDARITYEANEHLSLTAFVNNIENTPVRTFGVAVAPRFRASLVSPRTYGVTVAAKF